jgi:hypothetical protein
MHPVRERLTDVTKDVRASEVLVAGVNVVEVEGLDCAPERMPSHPCSYVQDDVSGTGRSGHMCTRLVFVKIAQVDPSPAGDLLQPGVQCLDIVDLSWRAHLLTSARVASIC